jgi:SAM-dependent methyltransferase
MTDRKEHWENVYINRPSTEVSWYQPRPGLSLRLIRDTGLDMGSPLIDVGGGASTLADTLFDEGYQAITVLDVSASALAHASDRLGKKACGIQWVEADITAFEPSRRYQLWHDRAVFHFLTDKTDRASYVETMHRTLMSGGHVIIMTFAIGGPQKCSGLDIVQYDAEKLLAELGHGFDLLDSGHVTHITPAGDEQEFAWFRLDYTGK